MALPGIARAILRKPRLWPLLLRRGGRLGLCPVCGLATCFYREGPWLRDQYRCLWCESIPRWRALVWVLEEQFPSWRDLQIHECSPGGPSSDKFANECRGYSSSHYFAGVQPGSQHLGFRCENLEQMTFEDASFDLMITQDVFEHIPRPPLAFQEIARVLRPGGAHVFTVPFNANRQTVTRVRITNAGALDYVLPPEYHENPVDPGGSLVITDWGADLADLLASWTGMRTRIVSRVDPGRGIEGEYLEVFVSSKA